MQRCSWAKTKSYQQYHDQVWGKPVFSDQALFWFLCLETQSCGLNFGLIWQKRQAYAQAFAFDDLYKLSQTPKQHIIWVYHQRKVICNWKKLVAIVTNAQSYWRLVGVFGSFHAFWWTPFAYQPYAYQPYLFPLWINYLTKTLKRFGFCFIGPSTISAYMQAIGIFPQHEPNCFLFKPKNVIISHV